MAKPFICRSRSQQEHLAKKPRVDLNGFVPRSSQFFHENKIYHKLAHLSGAELGNIQHRLKVIAFPTATFQTLHMAHMWDNILFLLRLLCKLNTQTLHKQSELCTFH